MNREQLYRQIQAKQSMLCVGLDVDFDKMPESVKSLATKGEAAFLGQLFKGRARSIVTFNKSIIDATAPYCVAYKPNLAFYECYGIDGMRALDCGLYKDKLSGDIPHRGRQEGRHRKYGQNVCKGIL